MDSSGDLVYGPASHSNCHGCSKDTKNSQIWNVHYNSG